MSIRKPDYIYDKAIAEEVIEKATTLDSGKTLHGSPVLRAPNGLLASKAWHSCFTITMPRFRRLLLPFQISLLIAG